MMLTSPRHQPRRLEHHRPTVAPATLGSAVALLLVLAGSPAAAGQSVVDQATAGEAVYQGMAPAYLRAVHLVSDLGVVDVRLSPFSAEGDDQPSREDEPALAESASYGAIGAYSAVAPESYAVSVRPAGEGLGGDPLLAIALTLEPGRAYTVMAVGPPGSAELQLLEDDLTSPPSGQAEVRLVSAAPGARVSVDGAQVVELVPPARDSDYVAVAAGKHTIEVDDGTTSTVQELGLASGSSYTLFATPGADGELQVQVVLDQAAAEVVPVGGIATGGGWLAGQEVRATRHPVSVTGLGAAGVLVVLLLVLGLLRRRTSPLLA